MALRFYTQVLVALTLAWVVVGAGFYLREQFVAAERDCAQVINPVSEAAGEVAEEYFPKNETERIEREAVGSKAALDAYLAATRAGKTSYEADSARNFARVEASTQVRADQAKKALVEKVAAAKSRDSCFEEHNFYTFVHRLIGVK